MRKRMRDDRGAGAQPLRRRRDAAGLPAAAAYHAFAGARRRVAAGPGAARRCRDPDRARPVARGRARRASQARPRAARARAAAAGHGRRLCRLDRARQRSGVRARGAGGGRGARSAATARAGRTIVLAGTDGAAPSALPRGSPATLAIALARIAELMDESEDVLVLYTTSHGAPFGLYYNDGDSGYGAISPNRLRGDARPARPRQPPADPQRLLFGHVRAAAAIGDAA